MMSESRKQFQSLNCLFVIGFAMMMMMMSSCVAFLAPSSTTTAGSHKNHQRQQQQQEQQGLFMNNDYSSDNTGSSGAGSSFEQLEFRIYPDGRVEETVRGVKGENCHKVTEPINEILGKVVASEPTEELYEQELLIDQTLTNSVDSSNDGGGWEGSSSW